MPALHILAAIHAEAAERYQTYFTEQETYTFEITSDKAEVTRILADPDSVVDALVIDNSLGGVFELVRELRQTYPRLLIVLVDEDADFSMPGRADDVTTTPFEQDDLLRRINRLVQERQTETLRADALPPIRSVAKMLRQATGSMGKAEAAVKAVKELGYDFVAYYRWEAEGNPLILNATEGPNAIISIAPDRQKESTLVSWVAQNGQSRIVGPDDDPNYSLVKRGRLGAGACVPVGGSTRYGVLLACKEVPDTITQENVMMLELIATQLSSALAKNVNR